MPRGSFHWNRDKQGGIHNGCGYTAAAVFLVSGKARLVYENGFVWYAVTSDFYLLELSFDKGG